MGQLAITRRFSLASVGEGWQDCYITFIPANYGDLIALKNLDVANMTDEQALEYQNDFVMKRVIGGKVLELDASGLAAVTDFTKDHLMGLPKDVFDSLFNAINGAETDPKGLKPTNE
jgi:hypothetical protein